MPDPPRHAETSGASAFLVFPMKAYQDDEEIGTRLVAQAQEGAEADREPGDSSVLLAASEPDAHTLTDTSGYNHQRPVPDATEQYCDSQLPIVRG